MSKDKMPPSMVQVLIDAQENKTDVITTVEAFHQDPEYLYAFLGVAANMGITVHMAPIKTTDEHAAPKESVDAG